MLVSVIEVCTTKFLKLVFTENLGKLDVYSKNVSQGIPKTFELTAFVCDFFISVLFWSCTLVFRLLTDEYSVKQTAILYLKLALKPALF